MRREEMAKNKFYAVKAGKRPGIYLTWEACKNEVHGFPGAVYKSFPTRAEAERYLEADGQQPDGLETLSEGSAVAYVDGSYDKRVRLRRSFFGGRRGSSDSTKG